MKERILLLLLLIVLVSIQAYAQITYESGYFVDNNNQKIACLIKNIDWKNNPVDFKYKLSKEGDIMETDIISVKEFGILNICKFLRDSVEIDRSSELISDLSEVKAPFFKKELLFLKVLVEGDASLYQYEDGNLIRYFYKKEGSDIVQLVYKSYETSDNFLAKNNQYKQQLWNELKCASIDMSQIENLSYKKKSLIKYFTDYNECHHAVFTIYDNTNGRDLFNLSFRPHINRSSLSIWNNISNNRDNEFGCNFGFGFGIEAEYIFPFNKNKWAICIEPSYQSYQTEKTNDLNDVSGGKQIAKVNYQSIELPLSLRYYIFLDNDAKLFTNVSYIFNTDFNSKIDFKRFDNSSFSVIDINSRNNFAIGLGYKIFDKFSIEMRYQFHREILSEYVHWNSEFKKCSIVLGYSIF